MTKINIQQMMAESGVAFGTSGARGLVSQMTDQVCTAYTLAFLHGLGLAQPGQKIALGMDLRPSSPAIVRACADGIRQAGCEVDFCGMLPTPALALYALAQGIPAIMVTGSHIPFDRNGIKFYRAEGEISKADEAAITQAEVELQAITENALLPSVNPNTVELSNAKPSPAGRLAGMQEVEQRMEQLPRGNQNKEKSLFVSPHPSLLPGGEGADALKPTVLTVNPAALQQYRQRYTSLFAADLLSGWRIGVYEHSSAARDCLRDVLSALGADVVGLGRTDTFVPLDTEAVSEEDRRRGLAWAAEHHLDAIISTDGDGDRPLIADETGNWLRGDIVGLLCAHFLGVDTVVTPVSCNTAIETSGLFRQVIRTRIGSPYVIAGMERMLAAGSPSVVGFEANGGFLVGNDLTVGRQPLTALPTRDAVLPALAVLAMARQQGGKVSALLTGLPQRYTASDRLQDFPVANSRALLDSLQSDDTAYQSLWGNELGALARRDFTDGLRLTFDNGEIVHLRPSGNAPELRCYAEADNMERAQALVTLSLQRIAGEY